MTAWLGLSLAAPLWMGPLWNDVQGTLVVAISFGATH